MARFLYISPFYFPAMASAKKEGGSRLYTPQEIIAYYRKHHALPPELKKRA